MLATLEEIVDEVIKTYCDGSPLAREFYAAWKARDTDGVLRVSQQLGALEEHAFAAADAHAAFQDEPHALSCRACMGHLAVLEAVQALLDDFSGQRKTARRAANNAWGMHLAAQGRTSEDGKPPAGWRPPRGSLGAETYDAAAEGYVREGGGQDA